MKSLLLIFQLFYLMLFLLPVSAGVVDSKHNLSISGPGSIKASTESQVCIFCHTPHSASPAAPLWNRASSGAAYVPYTSSTALASPGQPTGSSILCLSCHDGTIALGEVLSLPADISMSGGITTMPVGASRLETDLSDDHPISFNYTSTLASSRGELVNPSTLTGAVKLDNTGQMQCSSCHDAHDDTNGKFLVMANTSSALCKSCHIKNNWNETAHSTSASTWNAIPPDPWPTTDATTVAGNACENCHIPHNAGGNQRLLKFASEETNCYICHNGHVAAKDIEGEFNKFYRHPVTDTQGTHDPGEALVADSRHVECADCHNPHAANSTNVLNGVSGIDILGNTIAQVTASHQLCFRCHGDSTGKPAALTARQIDQTNVRLEFNTSNPSYHPVAGVGKNPNVPSLIPPWNETSIITCTDCHNNNNGPGAGGTGPSGPHGSTNSSLLERNYLTGTGVTESASNLCYKCHDQNILVDSKVSFAKHNRHINMVPTSCNTCHDPHGISVTQGNSVNNSHLINFDTSVVSPSSSGVLRYEDDGGGVGRCYLSCHGNSHNPKSYK